MLASVYYMTLNLAFWHESVKIYAILTQHVIKYVITLRY